MRPFTTWAWVVHEMLLCVVQAWNTIVGWLEAHCPEDAARLRPPATAADLQAAEEELGTALAADLASWWAAADGTTFHVQLIPHLFSPYSIRDALHSRDAWLQVSSTEFGEEGDPPGRAADPAGTPCSGRWLPGWLPIAGDGGGDDLFVDLRPGPAFGCVGIFRHEEWEFTGPAWPSVDAMLTDVARALTTGQPVREYTATVVDGVLQWDFSRPPRPARITDVTPSEAGIHRAIHADDAETELPAYVPRAVDMRLRAVLAEVGRTGGFVLLTGAPLTGKTRTLYEAVRAALPDREFTPVADDQRLMSSAGRARKVLWIDNLRADRFQPWLTLRGAQLLRRAGTVAVATCLPEELAALLPPVEPQVAAFAAAGARSHAVVEAETRAELAALITVLELPSELSATEQAAAENAAHQDARIRIALTDPAFIPALAAGPTRVQRWQLADDPYGWAFVTAAADARATGARQPLSRELLIDSARGYLQDDTVADWVDHSLDWATRDVHGAAGALTQTPTGYLIDRYLYDHVRRTRAGTPLPERAWAALLDHHHPADSFAIADGAVAHGRTHHAEALYRRLIAEAEGSDPTNPEDIPRRARAQMALELQRRADNGESHVSAV